MKQIVVGLNLKLEFKLNSFSSSLEMNAKIMTPVTTTTPTTNNQRYTVAIAVIETPTTLLELV